MEFNTVSISDGITMGSDGMRASLVSREVIADSIELVARGNLFDGLVVLVGCDKTIPGGVMAVARLDIPGLVLYGGSIAPGRWEDHDVTIQDVFEAVGAHAAGTMTDARLKALEDAACPGPGACGGQFTANTMATVCELIGISPMSHNAVPAMDDEKDVVARETGRLIMDLVQADRRPRQIMTRAALENGIASVAATGGSTNAVLHLLAIAREAEVDISIDDFDRISRVTPLLADLKPGRALRGHRPVPGRRDPASSRTGCRRRACCSPTRSPSPAAPSARRRRRRPRPPARRWCGRCPSR